MVKLCLIYSLNCLHSTNQNTSFFPVEDLVSISAFFQSHFRHFGAISPCYEKIFKISFRVILPLSRGDGLVPGFDGKYKFHSSFVYRFQTINLNPIKYLRLTNCYGKVNKKYMFWQSET